MRTPYLRARALPMLLAGLLAGGVGVGAQLSGRLSGPEEATVAKRFHLRPAHPADGLAVVAIDDATFSQLHQRWPFPRSLHAAMVERLHAAGVRAIVYDIQFSEPTTPREDLALYRALGRTGGAVLAATESDGHGHTNVLGGDANLAAVHSRAAASVLPVGRGGVVSRLPREMGGLDTLAFAAARRATGHAPKAAGGRVDFAGPPGSVPTYSFADVLHGRVPPRALRGRVVVVGAAAPTLQDTHPTPTTDRDLMSGPELQANAIWTVLHGFPLRDASRALALLLAILMSLASPLLRLRLRVVTSVVLALLVAAAYAATAQLAFADGTVLPVAVPLFALALGTVSMVIASHLGETAERRRIAGHNERLESLVQERTSDLRETQLEMVERLANAAESRDGDTGRHIQRIGYFCHQLALAVGMTEEDAEMLRNASAMHDVGKIGVPDRVLLKPGLFSPEERSVMETHTTIGASILAGSSAPLLRLAEEIALTHHERWDGTGYPNGLAGEDIPLPGRIVAVCDVFDALLSRRPYKEPWPLAEAVKEIRDQRGRQFDPTLVDTFLALAPRLHAELSPRAAHERDRRVA
jgi:response regulator RpfG family c-di-GMP phosphodiesterase